MKLNESIQNKTDANETEVENGEKFKATLTYVEENWQTNEKKPVSIEVTGSDMKEIYKKIVHHVVGLEWGASTTVAKNLKVITPEGEKSFDEIAKIANEK